MRFYVIRLSLRARSASKGYEMENCKPGYQTLRSVAWLASTRAIVGRTNVTCLDADLAFIFSKGYQS